MEDKFFKSLIIAVIMIAVVIIILSTGVWSAYAGSSEGASPVSIKKTTPACSQTNVNIVISANPTAAILHKKAIQAR